MFQVNHRRNPKYEIFPYDKSFLQIELIKNKASFKIDVGNTISPISYKFRG